VRREETGSDAWDTGVGYSSSIPPAPSSVPIPPNAAKWLQEGTRCTFSTKTNGIG
jgi:hypothetical protein